MIDWCLQESIKQTKVVHRIQINIFPTPVSWRLCKGVYVKHNCLEISTLRCEKVFEEVGLI